MARAVVYCPTENAYFFCSNEKLYRQNVSSRLPTPLFKIEREAEWISLTYSAEKNRLILEDSFRIRVINPKTSRLELVLSQDDFFDPADSVEDFITVDPEPLRIILLTSSGALTIDQLIPRKKQTSVLELGSTRIGDDFRTQKMVLCEDQRFLLVEWFEEDTLDSIFYHLIEVGSNTLKLKHSIKLF